MLAEDSRHPERKPILFKKKVGQDIKDKKRDKELGTVTHPVKGLVKKFPNSRRPSHSWVFGESWNLRG